ncbi:helix-turn-helix domain-containing protein [Caldinitratiruptor microaerophilus]|uniref:helix-turn-helix domain-containing protein n=1 Tax=Caldinitratiruptor microaerophilus TaxID=671077 RepID=UPI0038736016
MRMLGTYRWLLHRMIPAVTPYRQPSSGWGSMDLPTDRAFVTVETAARYLGIGRTMAYDLARRGRFPAPVIRAGRRYLVPVEALRRLAQGLPPVPKEVTIGPAAISQEHVSRDRGRTR